MSISLPIPLTSCSIFATSDLISSSPIVGLPSSCLRITSYNVCYTKLLRIVGLSSKDSIVSMSLATPLTSCSMLATSLFISSRPIVGLPSNCLISNISVLISAKPMVGLSSSDSIVSMSLPTPLTSCSIFATSDLISSSPIVGLPNSCLISNIRITSYNVCYTKLLRPLLNQGICLVSVLHPLQSYKD